MSESQFKLGQRWISNTEPELGLGVITDDENRRVTVQFPASSERRTYATDNAPLNRVQYQVGDNISNTQKLKITVTQVEEEQGYIVYAGLDENGEPHIIPELELNSFVQFNRPQDRLFAGQIDKLNQYTLRYKTLLHKEAQMHSQSQGLLGARVQLLPHQLHIANEAANRYAPRVLLADEVGLGKTIEAGLIIHHQLQTGRAERILIAVPDSLIHQWLVEMLRRFNLQFTVLDEERHEALLANDSNPFETTQLVLCSLDFLASNQQRQKQAEDTGWDLIVVDEAHHLVWSDDKDSQAGQHYRCVESLATHTKGLLLLTATPEQLGEESHFARLRLLDPNRYFDFEKYKEEEKGYQPANDLVQILLSDDVKNNIIDNSENIAALNSYVGEEKSNQLITALKASDSESSKQLIEHTINDCIQHLLDHHGTGRVLFRNTRAAVKGFPIRKLIPHPINVPADYLAENASQHFSVNDLLRPENIIGSQWLQEDSRVSWLVDWLKQHRTEKVLLICNQHETTLELEDFLRLKKGVRSTAFHSELSLIERDRAAAYFSDDIDGAQIMICSEIGSEGRNFQFAQHLILFDLPLNPDLLEQRIGRLARIGQRNDVQIHVPFYQSQENNTRSATEKLLEWHHKGINGIEVSCPAAHMLFQEFESRLKSSLTNDDENEWNTLISDTQNTTQALLEKLSEGRDQLLELNSCNHEKSEELIQAISKSDSNEKLPEYMSDVFEEFGVDEDVHSENAIVLHPTDHMHNHSFPGLGDEGLTATYNRDIALSREDMEFLTWEHPMVTGVMDMAMSYERGNTSVGTIKLPPLPPGTLVLESVFSVHCPGPKVLQLGSYFDKNTIRVFMSEKNNLSSLINFKQLNKFHQPVPNKKTAQGIVKHAKKEIVSLINKCQNEADQQKSSIIDKALSNMQERQQVELTRLKTLAKVNPNIRQEEIDYLGQSIEELEHHLQSAQLSLEMVRVVVCT
ncbi:MAG: RNA polymerase-associated protein RapA [Cellvibrionaceae bacterium]